MDTTLAINIPIAVYAYDRHKLATDPKAVKRIGFYDKRKVLTETKFQKYYVKAKAIASRTPASPLSTLAATAPPAARAAATSPWARCSSPREARTWRRRTGCCAGWCARARGRAARGAHPASGRGASA